MSLDDAPRGDINAPAVGMAVAGWIGKHSRGLFFALVLIGSARIVSTCMVFSHTWDEPDHIAAGLEWLTRGTLEIDYSHPPLAGVAAALGPYLASGATQTIPYADPSLPPRFFDRATTAGLAILERDGGYDRNLALARLGILPFFWVACLTVYLWARRYLGEPAAAFAVFFFTFLPPVLAHAGLATTDMAVTAFIGASFLTALIWIGKPTLPHSLLLGAVTGLAVLSKFSSLAYLPIALAAAVLWYIVSERPPLRGIGQVRKVLAPLGVAAVTCLVVVWAGYRFSFGPVAFGPAAAPWFRLPVPAPELFTGILNLARYNKYGHMSFLLGNYSESGWWYFFPVVLAVKTPLPFLALLLFGAAAAAGKNKGVWLALSFSLGILAFSLASHLNFGVRHILPVYTGFSIVAGAGAERLLALSWKSKWAGCALCGLVAWMAATSALSHPDYLAYFNALAGDKPENVLVDSDLDWGQDLKRLARRLQDAGAPSLAFTPLQPADLNAMGFPPTSPGNMKEPAAGWNAISLTVLMLSERTGNPWQARIAPQERIGKGIWLWRFPPNSATNAAR